MSHITCDEKLQSIILYSLKSHLSKPAHSVLQPLAVAVALEAKVAVAGVVEVELHALEPEVRNVRELGLASKHSSAFPGRPPVDLGIRLDSLLC